MTKKFGFTALHETLRAVERSAIVKPVSAGSRHGSIHGTPPPTAGLKKGSDEFALTLQQSLGVIRRNGDKDSTDFYFLILSSCAGCFSAWDGLQLFHSGALGPFPELGRRKQFISSPGLVNRSRNKNLQSFRLYLGWVLDMEFRAVSLRRYLFRIRRWHFVCFPFISGHWRSRTKEERLCNWAGFFWKVASCRFLLHLCGGHYRYWRSQSSSG